MKKQLLIACDIFQPEIDKLKAMGEIDVDVIYLDKYLHFDFEALHSALTACLNEHGHRKPVVAYGDLCLGFKSEMHSLLTEHGSNKVEGLNCIDCILGGQGRLLEIDPDHEYYFLTPAFIEFTERLLTGNKEENRRRFSKLKGIIVIDSLDNMEQYRDRIEYFSDQTGLPVVGHKKVGLSKLNKVIKEAFQKND